MKPPTTKVDPLAQLADAWQTKRTERLALQKQVDAMQKEENEYKAQLIQGLQSATIRAIGGALGTATLVTKREPAMADWDTLYTHIQATGEFDLMYRRVNAAAVKERWELGMEVPGVQAIEITDLSWSKAK